MPQFHIRGYVRHLAAGELVAAVSAIPEHGAPPKDWETLEETHSSHLAAFEAVHRLTGMLGEQVRARGDTVLSVRTV